MFTNDYDLEFCWIYDYWLLMKNDIINRKKLFMITKNFFNEYLGFFIILITWKDKMWHIIWYIECKLYMFIDVPPNFLKNQNVGPKMKQRKIK
jgi:hypothetical protein